MDSYSERRALNASIKLAVLGFAAIAALTLMGCSGKIIKIRGTVVTYESAKLSSISLTYFITDRKTEEYLQRGIIRIGSDGRFFIRIRHPKSLPYWIVIDGIVGVPEVSISNNAFEVADKRELEMNLGEVYIYDYIKILGDFSHPIALRDLKIQWQSNIPNVDSYKVELVGAISVSGIRGQDFAFDTIVSLIGEKGPYSIGNIEIIKGIDQTEGTFYLDVKAQRLIRGEVVVVGGAVQRLVTISPE